MDAPRTDGATTRAYILQGATELERTDQTISKWFGYTPRYARGSPNREARKTCLYETMKFIGARYLTAVRLHPGNEATVSSDSMQTMRINP